MNVIAVVFCGGVFERIQKNLTCLFSVIYLKIKLNSKISSRQILFSMLNKIDF